MREHRAGSRWASQLDDVRQAVERLRIASTSDGDAQRVATADWLDALFADVTSTAELRRSVEQALELYRGGMGSFRDVGTKTMAAAVDELGSALRAAR